MDSYSAMLANVMHEFQMKEIERIGGLIAEGLQSADILKSPAKLFGYRSILRNRLLEILRRAGNFGRGQVNAELKRQGV